MTLFIIMIMAIIIIVIIIMRRRRNLSLTIAHNNTTIKYGPEEQKSNKTVRYIVINKCNNNIHTKYITFCAFIGIN